MNYIQSTSHSHVLNDKNKIQNQENIDNGIRASIQEHLQKQLTRNLPLNLHSDSIFIDSLPSNSSDSTKESRNDYEFVENVELHDQESIINSCKDNEIVSSESKDTMDVDKTNQIQRMQKQIEELNARISFQEREILHLKTLIKELSSRLASGYYYSLL